MKLIDLTKQYLSIKKDVDKAIFQTLLKGEFILGNNLRFLEKGVGKLVGVRYAVGLNSGTDALFFSLKAMGIEKGDEVITTPFSFISTAEVIANCGARPVFVDINPETYNIDETKIEKCITKRTKVILPVHLYGQMASMEGIMKLARKYRLWVIEDAAQAIGAKQKVNGKWRMAGSIGDIGCFSFYPTKNLGAYGDAGMITTNNRILAEKIRMLRNHGTKKKYYHKFLGYSSRLDELQATILLIKLPHLSKWNRRRLAIARKYNKELSHIKTIQRPSIAKENLPIFHQYTIRTPHRDSLIAYFKKHSLPFAIHYPLPLHLQPSLKYLGYRKGDFPEAERASQEVISLPIYPELTSADQTKIINVLKRFHGS